MNIDMILNSYYQMGSICQISAQIVVSAKNPIHRIASQVIVFMMGAFIFMLLDFYFLGLTYIIVYVGAIAILFQFVIMMVHLPSGSDENDGNIPNTQNKIETTTTTTTTTNEIQKGSLLQSIKSDTFLEKSTNESILTIISSSISNKGKDVKKKDTLNLISSLGISCYILTYFPIDIWYEKAYTNINQIIDSNISSLNIFFSYFNMPSGHIYSYFYPSWAIEYLSITDIESLAILVYIAYPTAQIQIGIALWTVMIGIISICSPRI